MRINALIDSGADLNIISWDVWAAMGNPELTPTSINFVGFSANTTACLGKILIKVSIQDVPQYVLFYVANVGESIEQVILGRHWMQTTNCQLDWMKREYTLQVNFGSITGFCEHAKLFKIYSTNEGNSLPLMSSSQKTKLTSIQGEQKKEWVVPDQLLHAQGYGKGQHFFWVPKHMRSTYPTTNQRDLLHAKLFKDNSFDRSLQRHGSVGYLRNCWKLKGTTKVFAMYGFPDMCQMCQLQCITSILRYSLEINKRAVRFLSNGDPRGSLHRSFRKQLWSQLQQPHRR